MLTFLFGIVCGAAIVLVILYIIVLDPWSAPTPPPFVDQFRPVQIPEELRAFLRTGEDGQGISRWESCCSISLLLHMMFQEYKDSRTLRRWVHKRLQMEMNDLTTRSAAGRLIQEIRIRELSLGTKFVTVNSIRVENVEMSEDKNSFEKIVFVLDIDYSGGFETSIDVSTIISKQANLSVKITKLTGMVRVVLSRQPYNYWTFSFLTTPTFETEISSQIQGHQLKRLIPIIKESIRRALQRKHVWPNYKIRYRPLFPNPIFQASPPPSTFSHIKMEGGLEVTVLQCTRLKTSLLSESKTYEVFCTVAMDQKPVLQNDEQGHCMSVLLSFSRFDLDTPVGLTFDKSVGSGGSKPVRVLTVEDNSLADKAAFKPGDVLVAINSVPIRSERQAVKFLQQTRGDVLVLVERSLDDIEDEESKDGDSELETVRSDEDVVSSLQETHKEPSVVSSLNESARRHSVSHMDSSVIDTNTDSMASSFVSLEGQRVEKPSVNVQRTESARVPQVLISEPSFDIRRTRSESQIDFKTIEAAIAQVEVEEEVKLVKVGTTERIAPPSTLDGLLLDRIAPKIDKDRTLTQADANGFSEMTGSIASLSSLVSNRTDTGTEDVVDEEEDACRGQKLASNKRQKLQATLQAGKKRVLELIPQKKRSVMSESGIPDIIGLDEVAEDANLIEDRDNLTNSPIPAMSGKRSPVELHVVDKKEKKKKKRISDSPKTKGKNVSPAQATTGKMRSTKSVQMKKNVVWCQSLHFDLSSTSRLPPKYLNVTVHAKEIITSPLPSPTSTTPPVSLSDDSSSTPSTSKNGSFVAPTSPEAIETKPILLGSVSLFIPQLIDDCRLTLSDCHREVFQLKQPAHCQSVVENSDPNAELSRHAGFDPRLCFGDITLGFRYFPQGLPTGAALNSGDESDEEILRTVRAESAGRPLSPCSVIPAAHSWRVWYGKNSNLCAMCLGKIWLRNASCCSRCNVICHNKCVNKANQGGIICTPYTNTPDSEELSQIPVGSADQTPEQDHDSDSIGSLMQTPRMSSTPEAGDNASKRVKLRNKVSEKFSNWRKGSKKKDSEEGGSVRLSQASLLSTMTTSSQSSPDSRTIETEENVGGDSPVASIQEVLSDVLPELEGSPFISSLFFQPGNAYNEQTIKNAKKLGKDIFSGLPAGTRLVKINTQIDRIQAAIRETKDDRLKVMSDEGASTRKFQGLDERLQALAVLMLHYCAALQDCQTDRKDREKTLTEQKEPDDTDSIGDEETIQADAPTTTTRL